MISLSKDDVYLFNTGNAQRAYLTLGCHFIESENAHRFCVWAPNAQSVSVVGDFNEWDCERNVMEKQDGGIWAAMVGGLSDGTCYKYYIKGADGSSHYKADPFAFYSEVRPATASKVWSIENFNWEDDDYVAKRGKHSGLSSPMSIYEMHLGSWRVKPDGSYYSYSEIAQPLCDYLKQTGFTHVEFMPVSEHPFDGSWGYQVTGYYAITSRYGTPQEFMELVNTLHKNGFGVILDWVPGHFPRDEHGLRRFDGTALFEHSDPRQGEQPQWGTMLFNYGRPEVVSFLVSNAVFLADYYHIDGLRIDAVSSMLYLNFGKEEGQYVRNQYGGTDNIEAIELLKKINSVLLTLYPGFITVAEESSSYPLITRPPYDGGLGFNYKWDMGFMNDSLKYLETDHLFRKYEHDKLTFSMHYAFSENFILAFSHDEVVHGKHSMIGKMFGDYWQKFAGLRAFYGYMYAHPGKKLLFMGNEFGHFIEWNYEAELDWFLLEYDSHSSMLRYVSTLNKLYKKYRALYEIDGDWTGFNWLNVDDSDNSVFAFMRISKPWRGKTQRIVTVTNFTPVVRYNYRVNMPQNGVASVILNSDSAEFGGSGVAVAADEGNIISHDGYIEITVPPLASVYMVFTPDDEPQQATAKKAPTKKAAAKKTAPKKRAAKNPVAK